MKTKAIFAAGKQYQKNRLNQSNVKWEKDKDCQAIFAAMNEQGIRGCSACCGTFTGTKPNGKLFVLEIEDDKVSIKVHKNFDAYWNSFKR